MKLSQHSTIINECFDSIRDQAGRVTDDELGYAAGYSRSHITNIRHGNKRLSLGGLFGLCREYGADVVLTPVAERFSCRVVRKDTEPSTISLTDLALMVGVMSGRLQEKTVNAKADGHVSKEETKILRRAIRQVRQALDALEVSLPGGEE